MTVLKYFRETLSNWFGEIEDSSFDCCTYKQHEKGNNVALPDFRSAFGIDLNEHILFTRDTSFWSSHNQGLVITENALYCIPDNDNPSNEIVITWREFDKVSYKEYNFYFYDKDGQQIANIGSNFFFKNIAPEKLEKTIGKKLAMHLSEMAKLAGDVVSDYDEVTSLEDQEKYDKALSKLEDLMKKTSIDKDYLSHLLKGRILLKKELSIEDDGDENRFNLTEKELVKATELSDDPDIEAICNYWRAFNYEVYQSYFNARNLFISAMGSSSEAIREDAKEQFEIVEEKLKGTWDNYTNEYQYKDRQFLMPITDSQIAGCFISGIDTFKLSNIPSCIKFPTGHPIPNELYIGHPFKPELYVPYENSEDIFFVDKIHELCYLLECLGAEEISITSIKGRNVTEVGNIDSIMSGNVDVGLIAYDGNLSKSGKSERASTNNIQRTITQKFDPIKKPFVPDDLVWYPEQSQWQRLVKSRQNGNLLEYNEFVSSADTKFISNTERTNIKASAEYLWAKVDGNVEANSEEQFKESIETQWKVEVKFRSIKLFDDNLPNQVAQTPTSEYTKAEQEYLDNLKDFLEDDAEITPRERKMLDRIREKLGISKERAAELEASLKPQLTEDEKEYLDMYKEYIEEGEITDKERRKLDKFARALGIESDRIKEIEKLG